MLRRKYRKIITFSVPIKNDKGIKYRMKFIDSFRFVSTLLSSLVNNLSEGIHSNKCKNCNFYLEYIPATNNYLVFKCKKSVKKSIKTF